MDPQNPPYHTPVINRVLFGFITLLFASAFLKVPYWAIYQGRAPMNLIAFIPIFGLPIIGLTLITFKGTIRLRIHKIWTPVAIFSIAWVYYFMLVNAFPVSTSLADFLLNKTSESYLWAGAFYLIIGFVDWSVFYPYTYYFIFYTIFVLIFFVGSIITLPISFIRQGLPNSAKGINEANDMFSLFSAPFFAYFIVKKLKNAWPGWKKIGIAFGIFALYFVTVGFFSNSIGDRLPPESWVRQVLKSEKPPGVQQQGGIPLFQ